MNQEQHRVPFELPSHVNNPLVETEEGLDSAPSQDVTSSGNGHDVAVGAKSPLCSEIPVKVEAMQPDEHHSVEISPSLTCRSPDDHPTVEPPIHSHPSASALPDSTSLLLNPFSPSNAHMTEISTAPESAASTLMVQQQQDHHGDVHHRQSATYPSMEGIDTNSQALPIDHVKEETKSKIFEDSSVDVEPKLSIEDIHHDPSTPAGQTSALSDLSPLVREQLKYCSHILRSLKRNRDAPPFLQPVDPVALQIPDYFNVIKKPLDFGTIGVKLSGCQYHSAEEFIADVRLVFANCFTYNRPETVVYNMGKNLEKAFDNMLKKMPQASLPGRIHAVDEGMDRSRRASLNRKRKADSLEHDSVTPKRPSPSRTLSRRSSSGASAGSPRRKSATASYFAQENLKYCHQIIKELYKKQHFNVAWPFLQPVDPVALGIPDYFNVIKVPMDFSTMRRKLESKMYASAEEFEADFRLVCNNCYAYNAPETEVVRLCRAVEGIFNEKWNQRPSMTKSLPASGDDSYESGDERIVYLTKQIQTLQSELTELLSQKSAKKAGGGYKSSSTHGTPSHKKASHRESASAGRGSTGGRKKESALRPMSFDEKRQLSLDINDLPPEKLGRVVEIIHATMPQIRDSTDSDEIELDIDSLDLKTLHSLARYVKQCKVAVDSSNLKRSRARSGGRSMGLSSSDESGGSDGEPH